MKMSGKVWIVDDDKSIRWVLERALDQAGLEIKAFDNADDVLKQLDKSSPDAIISDIRMPGMDGLELLEKIQTTLPDLPIIIMTAHSDLESAVASYQGGAFEYLPKPFDVDDAVTLVKRAVEHAFEQKKGRVEAAEVDTAEIIGEAPAMQEVFRAIGRLSQSNQVQVKS
jgi:two-component system nitrogen regulation response regulator GlnG